MSWWPHVLNAGVVAIVLSWTAVRAITVYSQVDAVRRSAITMLGLMVAQLCLGFLAFITASCGDGTLRSPNCRWWSRP